MNTQNTFDLKKANENIDHLIEWIEDQKAMAKQYPSFNSDVDIEEVSL